MTLPYVDIHVETADYCELAVCRGGTFVLYSRGHVSLLATPRLLVCRCDGSVFYGTPLDTQPWRVFDILSSFSAAEQLSSGSTATEPRWSGQLFAVARSPMLQQWMMHMQSIRRDLCQIRTDMQLRSHPSRVPEQGRRDCVLPG